MGGRTVFGLATVLGLTAGAAFLALIVMAERAGAHDAPSGMPYDSWCCNGNAVYGDCSPIPAASVKPIPGGFAITLRPGDHHLVTTTQHFTKKQSESRLSTDGQYHACLYPQQDTLRCFYYPPMGM